MEQVSVLLAREFVSRGYGVEFVLRQARGELLANVPAGVSVVDLKAPRLRNMVVPLVRYLHQHQPSMLLAAMWPLSGMAPVSARFAGVKCRVVVSEHSNLSRSAAIHGLSDILHRRLGRYLYGAADGVIAVSKGVKDDLVGRTGLAPDAVTVIYNPIRPILKSARPAAEASNWLAAGQKNVISVGALKDAKDYPTLLKAFSRLRQTVDARLLILGEGNIRGDLESLVASLGLCESVTMPGFVPDPYPYLEQADLFVLSSAWEGFGNVIVEALLSGVPVVSTDCPSGPAEILENGKYGRLVPVGDPEALAAAMAEALNVSHDRDMLRRRGAEFSVERAADQYLALLDPDGTGRARQ